MVVSNNKLSPEEFVAWRRDGILFLPAEKIFEHSVLADLMDSLLDVCSWPEQAHRWMQYFEEGLDIRRCNRIEYFLPFHEALNRNFRSGTVANIVSELFGEDAVLFKEKINFKYPGGVGFEPHQDAQAGWDVYGHTQHISVMIAIDPATIENGCLEAVRGAHLDGLIGPMGSRIPPDVEKQLEWEAFECAKGDMVFFNSYVPHRSATNTSKVPRRALFATYNKASEGDVYSQYFARKRLDFPPDIERTNSSKVYKYKI